MVQKLPQRPLGAHGSLSASAQGLGIMSFGNAYSDEKHKPTEKENQEVLERAAELGASFIDTANVYGNGLSEEQLGIAIEKGRKRFMVATKVGAGGASGGAPNGKPEYIRSEVEKSLKRLKTDYIDLYYQHRVDRTLPIEETWKALKELVDSGKVGYLGISEASSEEIRRAHAVHPISAVQLEWSLFTRNAEDDVIPTCRELGIAIVPYSPLGRGLLTGEIASAADFNPNDRRKNISRFQGKNFEHNVQLIAKLKEKAKAKGITAGQLALAWLHHQGDDVFPIPGTKRVKYLEENVAAFFVKLTKEEVAELSELFHPDAIKGTRALGAGQAAWHFENQKK